MSYEQPAEVLIDPVIKLYRTRGLNPRGRPKGRAAISPLWNPLGFVPASSGGVTIKSLLKIVGPPSEASVYFSIEPSVRSC